MIYGKYISSISKGSRPYPSDNAKRQFDVMSLTHPPTYYNVKGGNKCIPHEL